MTMKLFVRVVLVDGHSGTREALIHRLGQMHGISVVGAASDEGEALKVVGSRRPDVVIIDPRSISANGAAFLHRLAAVDPHLGIVVLTAYLAEGEQTNLIRAGAQTILFKEIGTGALVVMIRRVASRGVSGRKEQEAGGAPVRWRGGANSYASGPPLLHSQQLLGSHEGAWQRAQQIGSVQSLSSVLREAKE